MPQRYFLDQFNQTISGQDAHHIKKVMRMKKDDEIIVCFQGNCFLASIEALEPEVTYQIKEELIKPNDIDITLIQGLPKHPKAETVVKYATMFGVQSIILTTMKRSIAKIENEENKTRRLETIAKEAAELAHRFDIPSIHMIKSFSSIDLSIYDLILLADENEKKMTLNQLPIDDYLTSKIALIIGPEGGISKDERHALLAKKAVPISLGNHILPTEIACLYVLSYLSIKNS